MERAAFVGFKRDPPGSGLDDPVGTGVASSAGEQHRLLASGVKMPTWTERVDCSPPCVAGKPASNWRVPSYLLLLAGIGIVTQVVTAAILAKRIHVNGCKWGGDEKLANELDFEAHASDLNPDRVEAHRETRNRWKSDQSAP